MRTLTFTLIGILCSAILSSAQDSLLPSLSLDEAVALGLAHNRAIANAAMEVDKASHDIATARSRRLPVFSIESQASQLLRPIDITFPRGAFGTLEGIGPVPSADAVVTTPARLSFVMNAQATQPLSQLYKLNLNIKLAETAQAYDREQLRDSRLALVSQIKRAYYEIVRIKSALDAHERTIQMLRELDRVVANRVVQQVALKSDALSAKSSLANAELSRVDMQNALDSRKEQLNQLIGRDVRFAFDVEDLSEALAMPVAFEAIEGRAIDARPDVQQARIRLEQARLSRRVAKSDYLPELGLNVSYYAPINIDGAPRHIASGAIQMKWEPFDWGRKGRALAEKEIEIRQAQNGVRDAEDRAALEIRSRARTLDTARARLSVARANEDTARETARISLIQYGTNAALFVDVLKAQSSLADANHQYQEALAAFWSAQADLDRATAEDSIQ